MLLRDSLRTLAERSAETGGSLVQAQTQVGLRKHEFDAACNWLAENALSDGTLLMNHAVTTVTRISKAMPCVTDTLWALRKRLLRTGWSLADSALDASVEERKMRPNNPTEYYFILEKLYEKCLKYEQCEDAIFFSHSQGVGYYRAVRSALESQDDDNILVVGVDNNYATCTRVFVTYVSRHKSHLRLPC